MVPCRSHSSGPLQRPRCPGQRTCARLSGQERAGVRALRQILPARFHGLAACRETCGRHHKRTQSARGCLASTTATVSPPVPFIAASRWGECCRPRSRVASPARSNDLHSYIRRLQRSSCCPSHAVHPLLISRTSFSRLVSARSSRCISECRSPELLDVAAGRSRGRSGSVLHCALKRTVGS